MTLDFYEDFDDKTYDNNGITETSTTTNKNATIPPNMTIYGSARSRQTILPPPYHDNLLFDGSLSGLSISRNPLMPSKRNDDAPKNEASYNLTGVASSTTFTLHVTILAMK